MSKQLVLIVDDEPHIRELLEITLGRMKIHTHSAGDIATAKKLLAQHTFGLCLTDMKLPDGNGLTLVEHIQQQYPTLPVAVITAFGSMETDINALKCGAFDFLSKPVDIEQLRNLVNAALNLATQNPTAETSSILIGNSPVMQALHQQIIKVAKSQAPVYIHGESGTGKELVARSIHLLGPRAAQPFMPVNCGAIPRDLMESEFFGHRKGSFTGAISDKPGLFQAANGGTLFLDEVAELPLDMQVKLLRTIQEKTLRPVGAEKEVHTDVRVLCATHKNLEREVQAGNFRQDLFYRLNVIQIDVPSLRDRNEDIALLCTTFLQKFSQQGLRKHMQLAPDALALLNSYSFPGNVRELENILERAYTLCESDVICAQDLRLPTSNVQPVIAQARTALQPAAINEPQPVPTGAFSLENHASIDDYLASIEKDLLLRTLDASRWNRTTAAKKLGITFRQIRYKLTKLGIGEDDEE